MSFKLDIGPGLERAKYWGVFCDFCSMIEHFPVARFPDFPAAFHRAIALGWDVTEDTRRVARYSCPSCTKAAEEDLKRRGEG